MQTLIALCGRKRTGKESVYKLMYQHVVDPKEFQFATPLKKYCIDVLGLTHEQCYGNDAARESLTRYTWNEIAEHIRVKYKKNPEDRLTARDVLQIVGTDLMRNEVQAIVDLSEQNAFGPPLISRLYRETGLVDPHTSESALDSQDIRPNQRSITPGDHPHLIQRGYTQVLSNLWQGDRRNNKTYYDFLIDNNSTLENLKNAVIFMLNSHGLYHEILAMRLFLTVIHVTRIILFQQFMPAPSYWVNIVPGNNLIKKL
jgi:hypothetical protein